MTSLKELRSNSLGKNSSEEDEAYLMCDVMKVVGGYAQLMELPLPALEVIVKYLQNCEKEQKKLMGNMPKMKK